MGDMDRSVLTSHGFRANRRQFLIGAAGVLGAGALMPSCGGSSSLSSADRTVHAGAARPLKGVISAYATA